MKASVFSIIFIVIFFVDKTASQEMWGMTKYGGKYEKGVIFKMDENAANQQVVFSFEVVHSPEGRMTEFTDGIFYGTTAEGGALNLGVLYRFNLDSGGFTKILDFNGEEKGKDPAGSMVFAPNGKMYGMTASGGVHNLGILFEFNPSTVTFTKKVDFNGSEKGSEPLGSLMISSDGILYGMTSMGGNEDAGVLFSYHPGQDVFTKLYDFKGEDTGSSPMGCLMQASDGKLYGMTRWGGTHDYGVIFSYDPASGEFNNKFDFEGEETGRNPHGSLIETSGGKLYGMTPFGGSSNRGVLFEFDIITSQFAKKFEFTGSAMSGIAAYGSLVKTENGKLFGLLKEEFYSDGVLFEYDPKENTYHRFYNDYYLFREFSVHSKSLLLTDNGGIYYFVTDENNELKRENSLVEFDPVEKSYTNQFRFSGISTGGFPVGSLMQATNGLLYGMTSIGGTFNNGVVFTFDPENNHYEKLFDFEGFNGATPFASLVQAESSNLFGMTREGGTSDKGVLFEIDPASGEFLKHLDFNGENGQFPEGDLIKAANGLLYGVTTSGGEYNLGVLFEINPASGSYQKLIDFDGEEKGSNPSEFLVVASDGNIYGVTGSGGIANNGVLFQYDVFAGKFEKIIEFGTGDTGKAPLNLSSGTNDKLYGYSPEFIFEFDPADYSWTKELMDMHLFGLSGRLLQASNGKFYGMGTGLIWYRATEGEGQIFEIDLEDDTFMTLLEFNGENGANPKNSSLIQTSNYNAPVAVCKNINLYLDEFGKATLKAADVNDGSSGSNLMMTVGQINFTCNDLGENQVSFTVTDDFGNSSVCEAVVTVTDTLPPDAICRNILVSLDAAGFAVIHVDDINDGSADACGIQKMAIDTDTFSCENLGENTVEFSVTDINGNVSTCQAVVTVTDDLAPEISCHSDLTRYLNPYEAQYVPDDKEFDAEIADNCGIESIKYSFGETEGETLSGVQFEAGTYEVNWSAIDFAGNKSDCISLISIEKRPTVLFLIEKEMNLGEGTAKLKAVLMDELLVEGIEGKSLTFTFGNRIKTAITDENGLASVTFYSDENLSGIFTVAVSLEEDETYSDISTESEIITGTVFFPTLQFNVYPNPFSERLYFEFVPSETANTRIDVFDPTGRLVKTIFNQPVEAGLYYKVEFTPVAGAEKFLIYQMNSGGKIKSGKIIHRR